MRAALSGVLVVTVLAAAPVYAQSGRSTHFRIGGGMSTPLSDVADRFDTGGAFTLGLSFEPPDAPLGLQVEYGFHSLGGPETRIPLMVNPLATATGTALIESTHKVHYVVANALLQGKGIRRFQAYGQAGGGMYHRSVNLTTPDVGFTSYCDPYWYVCFAEPVEVDRVIGERSTWDPGVNLGGGVAIRLGPAASFYVEARWHYTWGPTFTNLDGEEQHANGKYFPVTFGVKF